MPNHFTSFHFPAAYCRRSRGRFAGRLVGRLTCYLTFFLRCWSLVAVTAFAVPPAIAASDTRSDSAVADREGHCVVLLHGLARTANSMSDLQQQLEAVGYLVANIDYPSREKTVAELANMAVPEGIDQCRSEQAVAISFVTHSMGGILVRHYMANHQLEELKRVVMLAPPNQGSQVVDELRSVPGFGFLNGPAGSQLGTDEDSVPQELGAVDFELGIVAGTRTINPILSTYLPNPDDGKVSVENTKVEGMCAFLTVAVSHPFIMSDDTVIEQVIHFLDRGTFSAETAQHFSCAAMKQDLVTPVPTR